MKKKLSCMLLAILFTLPLAACGESEESKQIKELKALISAQSQTIAELNGSLSSLQSALETQGESLEELQAVASAQAEEIILLRQGIIDYKYNTDISFNFLNAKSSFEYSKIKEQIETEQLVPKFCDLNAAYEKHLIDLEDVKHIAYFLGNGNSNTIYAVDTSEPDNTSLWQTVEFTPTRKQGELSAAMKVIIQETYFETYSPSPLLKVYNLSVGFYGEYNGCYIVKVVEGNSVPTVVYPYSVAGIGIWSNAPLVRVFYFAET